ncbi:hypothetical protein [Streptomyces sp. NPDC093591]|uniref:hypothetical protein n=1 Tax=Streptomyces sp. NPDC093591 TaxID=3366044 RepID=UPI00382A082A
MCPCRCASVPPSAPPRLADPGPPKAVVPPPGAKTPGRRDDHQYTRIDRSTRTCTGGHFRSFDLLTWEELPVALTATPGSEDADGCFSGNAVSDGDRMVAFCSAFRTDRWARPVTTAESRDNGVTWTPLGSLLIADLPEGARGCARPARWGLRGRSGCRRLTRVRSAGFRSVFRRRA